MQLHTFEIKETFLKNTKLTTSSLMNSKENQIKQFLFLSLARFNLYSEFFRPAHHIHILMCRLRFPFFPTKINYYKGISACYFWDRILILFTSETKKAYQSSETKESSRDFILLIWTWMLTVEPDSRTSCGGSWFSIQQTADWTLQQWIYELKLYLLIRWSLVYKMKNS